MNTIIPAFEVPVVNEPSSSGAARAANSGNGSRGAADFAGTLRAVAPKPGRRHDQSRAADTNPSGASLPVPGRLSPTTPASPVTPPAAPAPQDASQGTAPHTTAAPSTTA